jgi:hypothetical protein
MANYENLPVYKDAYDLLLKMYRVNVKMPREHRYTLGVRLKDELMETLLCVYRANSDKDKKEENLRCAREHIMVVKIHLRLMHDLQLISWERFAAYAQQTENVSKQITAWHKSTCKGGLPP